MTKPSSFGGSFAYFFSFLVLIGIFLLLASSCEKERTVRYEVISSYSPFRWSIPDNDPYFPLYTMTTDSSTFDIVAQRTRSNTMKTYISIESLAPDSIHSTIKGSIYSDGELVISGESEGYGSFEFFISEPGK